MRNSANLVIEMDSITSGRLKMRQYFAEQRAASRKRPVKVNIPYSQELLQDNAPVVPQSNQQHILVQQPKSRFNTTGLGLTITLVGIVGGYMYLTTPSIKTQVDTLITQGIGKLSILSNSNLVMGIIALGIGLAIIGLITRK